MHRATILPAVLSLAVVLVIGLISFTQLQPLEVRAGAGDVTLVAIDTTIAGNDDSTVGPIDSCIGNLSVGDTLTFDLVVVGVDDADRIAGYTFDVDYDPGVIDITDVLSADVSGSDPPNNVTLVSRIESSGGLGIIDFSDYQTTAGSMTLSAIDTGSIPAPPGAHESGDGVLARVTVTAVEEGVSFLELGGQGGGADGHPVRIVLSGRSFGDGIPIEEVRSGAIAVAADCPSSIPTPAPTPEHTEAPPVTQFPTGTPPPTGPLPTGTPPPNGPQPTGSFLGPNPTPTGFGGDGPGALTPTGGGGGVGDGPGQLPPSGGIVNDEGSGWAAVVRVGVVALLSGGVALVLARRRPV